MSVKRLDPATVRFFAVVLAAGAGRRFGGAKLRAPFRGAALLDGALAAAFAAPVSCVVVTVGSDPEVGAIAERHAAARGEAGRLRLAQAADWLDGLSASLRAGLEAGPAEASGAFVFLGDMPLVDPATASALAGTWTGEDDAVQPLHAGQPGHPVLLGARLFPAARALRGDRGAQRLLDAPGVRTLKVELGGAGSVLDVDTPDALARLQGEG